MIEIKCTPTEQILLKRSIKGDSCKGIMCEFKTECDKPPDITCGEHINSMIKWEVVDESRN